MKPVLFRSIALASISSALLVVLLAGCAVQQGSGLTVDQARTQFYSALDETQGVVGGSWENKDDPTARGCVIPLWVEGSQFPGLRVGSAPHNLDDALAAVTEAWTDWGLRVEQAVVGEATELQGRNDHNELLIFRVTTLAMTLQGESECRPAR